MNLVDAPFYLFPPTLNLLFGVFYKEILVEKHVPQEVSILHPAEQNILGASVRCDAILAAGSISPIAFCNLIHIFMCGSPSECCQTFF